MADRYEFQRKFLETYTLNPNGENWLSIAEMLAPICTSANRKLYPWSSCVLWAREICAQAGLTREDRILAAGHVDQTEGYFGVTRK